MARVLTRCMVAFGAAAATMGLLLAHAAAAQEIAGTWHGALSVPTGELRLVVKVEKEAGGYAGTMLSPDQGAGHAIPLSDVSLNGDRLRFSVPQIHGRFEAHWDAAHHAWAGEWTQGRQPAPDA
jgi:hypothetical protein